MSFSQNEALCFFPSWNILWSVCGYLADKLKIHFAVTPHHRRHPRLPCQQLLPWRTYLWRQITVETERDGYNGRERRASRECTIRCSRGDSVSKVYLFTGGIDLFLWQHLTQQLTLCHVTVPSWGPWKLQEPHGGSVGHPDRWCVMVERDGGAPGIDWPLFMCRELLQSGLQQYESSNKALLSLQARGSQTAATE